MAIRVLDVVRLPLRRFLRTGSGVRDHGEVNSVLHEPPVQSGDVVDHWAQQE